MQSNIEQILKEYKNQYLKIFKNLYPSEGSVGFTERNLSVNFCNAFEKVHREACAWYEVSFEESSKYHFDAILVNPPTKEVFIIEAKRFSDPSGKLTSLGNDISRILEMDNKNRILNKLYDKDVANYTTYGVVLADVWEESDVKKDLSRLWREKNFFDNDYVKSKLNLTEEQLNIISKERVMEILDFKDQVISKSISNDYKLLTCIWKL